MPRPQSFKRLVVEDFPEKERESVGKIANSINPFAEDILECLNNNLSMEDNLAAAQRSVTVTTSSGVPTAALTIPTGLTSACAGTQVIKALNKTTATNSPTSQPFITFTNEGGFIKISKITGLQDNEKYVLTVILWPA